MHLTEFQSSWQREKDDNPNIKTMTNPKLNNAAYDLKFLLNRGYRKKSAVKFVSNKYLLNENERNYLVRKTFSNDKSMSRMIKIIDIDDIYGKTILIDGYNVLITVEIIFNNDYDALLMCDDGILRDLKAVFGKYHMKRTTEKSLKTMIKKFKLYKPNYVKFFYDSPVSWSGELARLTNSLLEKYEVDGTALTERNVDYEIVNQSKIVDGIVATSDGAIVDRVEMIVDIPYCICTETKKQPTN